MSIAIDPVIQRKLNQFIDRRRRWTIAYALFVALAVWVAGILLFTLIDSLWIIDRGHRSLLSLATYILAAIAAVLVAMRRLRGDDPLKRAAIAIENATPALKDQLLSAVELSRVAANSESSASHSFIGALQQNVALKLRTVDVRSLLPARLLTKPFAIAVAAVLVCIVLSVIPQLEFGRRFARAVVPGFDIDRVSRTRILIERPTPPSRTVPMNEITAIVARLEGDLPESASLEWYSDDGFDGDLEMHLSTLAATVNESNGPATSYSVNLPVNQSPLSYRIIAGDGVTKWQRLEPRERPSVVEFEMVLTPPEYTKLPPTTLSKTDGNIRALKGSRVQLRLRFNMDVKNVVMRTLNSDQQFPLIQDGDRWIAETSVSIDDRYQILATSAETDFDNPLSPQYSISALEDAPPLATWKEKKKTLPASKARRELVTAFSTLNLAASFVDEMPMADVRQEISINDGPWSSNPLAGTLDGKETSRSWQWDLNPLRHKERELAAGDVIKTRVVAIDRKGSRGESSIKEFIVNDQEFDAVKQKRLRSWIVFSDDISKWLGGVTAAMVQLNIEDKPEGFNEEEASAARAAMLNDLPAREKLIETMLSESLHEAEAAKVESIARVMRRVEDAIAQASMADETKRREFGWIKNNAVLVYDSVRSEVAHHLHMVMVDNLERMSASIEPTVRESDPIDWQTYPRYFEVTRQQYQELSTLMKEASGSLPDSTRQHGENLQKWIDEEMRRLTDAILQGSQEQIVRGVARHTVDDLQHRRRNHVVDGRVPALQVEYLKRLQNAIGWTRDSIHQMAALSKSISDATDALRATDSEQVRQAREKKSKLDEELSWHKTAIISRLQQEGRLHRLRPEADQRYVADTHLLERVLERVGSSDYAVPSDKTLEGIYREIASAYHWLESSHETTQWGRELRSLADDDRWNKSTASGRVDSPNRIDRYTQGLEHSVNGLQQTGLPWAEMEPIASLRWNQEISSISSEITSRRWDQKEYVPAGDRLGKIHDSFVKGSAALEPHLLKARQILEGFLPSIADQAREAAEKLRQAKQDGEPNDPEKEKADQEDTSKDKSDDEKSEDQKAKDAKTEDQKGNEDSKDAEKTAEDLNDSTESTTNPEQALQDAMKQTEKLRESLADEANVQDLKDPEGLRQARNADIASKAVEKRMEEVKAADESAKQASMDHEAEAKKELDEKLEKAAQTLDQIAEHYEKEKATKEANESDKGSDEQSDGSEPPSLQSLEQELGLTESLDQQFAKSNAIAKAINDDPRELLKKLLQELKRNKTMQEELENIADQTVDEAQRRLDEQAARERDLQLQLERSDPAVQAAKRELEEAVRRTAERGQEVKDALLTAAQQATNSIQKLPESSANKAQEAKKGIEKASETLQQAIQKAQQIGSADNELLADLQERAADVEQALGEANETLNESQKPTDEILRDPEAAMEAKSRDNAQRDMENIQRRARDNQTQFARNAQRRAEQQHQQAEQEQKQAKSQLDREEDNLRKTEDKVKREPDNAGLKAEAERLSREVAKAKARAEATNQRAELTKQSIDQSKARLDQVANSPLPALDSPQPPAQLAKAMQEKASQQLENVREQLKQSMQASSEASSLEPTFESLDSTLPAQQRVASEVADTAEDLARAARHQQRLGQLQMANQTAEMSEAVKNIATGEAQQASESLADAKQALRPTAPPAAQGDQQAAPPAPNLNKANAESKAARSEMRQSQSALAEQAKALAEASASTAQSPSNDNASPSQPSSNASAQAAESAQQMARTLDELDQALSSSPPKDGPPSSASTPSELATLKAAARRQSQKMAMQRGPKGQKPSPPSDTPSPPSESTTSGDGDSTAMSDVFGLDEAVRASDAEWGQLQARESEDVAQERRIEISPQYRKQIEAYFRVIAEQGKE